MEILAPLHGKYSIFFALFSNPVSQGTDSFRITAGSWSFSFSLETYKSIISDNLFLSDDEVYCCVLLGFQRA